MMQQSDPRTLKPLRTVGVEEELLLVDARTGAARSVASQVLRVAQRRGDTEDGAPVGTHAEPGGSIGSELQEQQLETDTPPEQDLGLLASELSRWREKAGAAAAESGALVLASGTTPLPVHPETVDEPRYMEIASRFGLTASEQLSCGYHVHVAVDSDEEAVATLDRIRVWLPTLLALSANSPFWQGNDSGYESYRSQVMPRWPTSGPTEIFGSARAYADHLDQLVATQVPLDAGMAYFDARPSARYPTLEIRVTDVCLNVPDAVLIAALCRGLVETASTEWQLGHPPAPASVALMRLAMWQAGRYALTGDLLDPAHHRPRPARTVVNALFEHVEPALRASGDLARVEHGIDDLYRRGTGATRQRSILAENGGRLDQAVVELARMTCGQGQGL